MVVHSTIILRRSETYIPTSDRKYSNERGIAFPIISIVKSSGPPFFIIVEREARLVTFHFWHVTNQPPQANNILETVTCDAMVRTLSNTICTKPTRNLRLAFS